MEVIVSGAQKIHARKNLKNKDIKGKIHWKVKKKSVVLWTKIQRVTNSGGEIGEASRGGRGLGGKRLIRKRRKMGGKKCIL